MFISNLSNAFQRKDAVLTTFVSPFNINKTIIIYKTAHLITEQVDHFNIKQHSMMVHVIPACILGSICHLHKIVHFVLPVLFITTMLLLSIKLIIMTHLYKYRC